MCLQACRLLSDDYEQVRSAAVQMVWVLSHLYPERWAEPGRHSFGDLTQQHLQE